MVRDVGEMVRKDAPRRDSCSGPGRSAHPSTQARLPLPLRAQIRKPGEAERAAARYARLWNPAEDTQDAGDCGRGCVVADVKPSLGRGARDYKSPTLRRNCCTISLGSLCCPSTA